MSDEITVIADRNAGTPAVVDLIKGLLNCNPVPRVNVEAALSLYQSHTGCERGEAKKFVLLCRSEMRGSDGEAQV